MNKIKSIKQYIITKISVFIVEFTAYFWIFYFKLFLKGKIVGSENISKSGCIFAFNHVSYLDWILVYVLFKRKYNRKIYFIGKSKLLKNLLWKIYLRGSDTIIIDNESKESLIAMLKTVKFHLQNGHTIGIFPEGTRSFSGRLQKAQEGIGHILLCNNVPVIPIGLIGFYDAWPRHKKYPGISDCTIKVGASINFKLSDFEDKKNSKSLVVDRVMMEIGKLTGDSYNFINSNS